MWKLFLLFTVVPAVELFLLLQIGALLGPTPTFLMLLGSGILGAWLAKREGMGVLRQLQDDLGKGLPPASRLVEGALVITGSLLLITPGVLTDFAGILVLLPPVRRWLAPRVIRWGAATFGVAGPDVTVQVGAPRPRRPNPFTSRFD